MKVDVEHFGYNNFLQDFKFRKNVVKTAIAVTLSFLRLFQTFIAIFTTFHESKVLIKIITTKTFNIDFHKKIHWN